MLPPSQVERLKRKLHFDQKVAAALLPVNHPRRQFVQTYREQIAITVAEAVDEPLCALISKYTRPNGRRPAAPPSPAGTHRRPVRGVRSLMRTVELERAISELVAAVMSEANVALRKPELRQLKNFAAIMILDIAVRNESVIHVLLTAGKETLGT